MNCETIWIPKVILTNILSQNKKAGHVKPFLKVCSNLISKKIYNAFKQFFNNNCIKPDIKGAKIEKKRKEEYSSIPSAGVTFWQRCFFKLSSKLLKILHTFMTYCKTCRVCCQRHYVTETVRSRASVARFF